MGVQYTTNTARDIMYWPHMHTELVEAVQRYLPGVATSPLEGTPHHTPSTQDPVVVGCK